MGGPNGLRRQPNLLHVEDEDEYSIENEPVNPFARRETLRDYRTVHAHAN